MKQRIITAIIGISIFIPFVIVGGRWFSYGVLILGAVALYEMAEMKKIDYLNEIGLISTLALSSVLLPEKYFAPIFSNADPLMIFYLAGMLLLILTVYNYQRFNFVDASTLIFASLYIGFGFRYLIMIRDLGLSTILYLLLVIWSTDTGAYLIGRKLGKHKLAPQISPNKTVEGALGGILTALIVTSIYGFFFTVKIQNPQCLGFLTILISISGQFGDLVESAYKRDFGVKDSGKLLPGHGGVLDRFDSTIFASIMFVVWNNFLGV
ncbi:phosphatidate cytidylyltransferase [Facklamia miroungae]|uniref:Phosphatidate cytidylyltransferase n=1 Tax=Facklamia miroungae TaxID=120956 RepID=A0A1G7P3A5_9LACT|nr:phosphatidate cytidylyltransferase [Facklamia miroungae]NKZ28567.1 phosphatidate cytidylyltransferase [Facklamia miroungae]SDF80792.1 phosphatidate cytidylyltransferase [Facklamia miroungae]